MGCPGASGPGPRAWVLRLLLGLAAWRGGAGGRSPVCGCCPGPARNGSSVASYCRAHPALELRGRCCVGPEPGAIVGLDLGNCSLTLLCAGFPDASAAVVIDLTENPLENIPNASFQGFTRLQSISLPLALECPGGSMAWDRITTHSDSRTCQGQRNPCNSSGELGHLSHAALLWDPGSCDDHPVPAGLGHPAPKSQGLLNPSWRTGEGRRLGWGACAGASPQPLSLLCWLPRFACRWTLGGSALERSALAACTPSFCTSGGDPAPACTGHPTSPLPRPPLRSPNLTTLPPQGESPAGCSAQVTPTWSLRLGSSPPPEHRSSLSRTWALACKVPCGVEASGSDTLRPKFWTHRAGLCPSLGTVSGRSPSVGQSPGGLTLPPG
ncbi:unnamed protein product [Caretta caretta]